MLAILPFMIHSDRISFDPEIMGGKPLIRGMRVTVEMVVGLVASGGSNGDSRGIALP